MTTLLDVVADLEKLANDLKAIHGTIWGKELQTFTPLGAEKTSQDSADTTATEPTPTLEEVRALSAQKSRAGLTKEVKAIIQKHGGTKLSDVAESEFPAMLAELQALPEEKR